MIQKIDMIETSPYPADPTKLMGIAAADCDLTPLFPHIREQIPDADGQKESISFNKDGVGVTLARNSIRIAPLDTVAHLHELLGWLRQLLNDLEARRAEGLASPDPTDIYQYLPKANCGKCGSNSCLSFALMLSQRAVRLEKCSLLYEVENAGKRSKLLNLFSPQPSAREI